MPLFDRKVSVLIGRKGLETALNVTDLRVTFSVKKTATAKNNSCTVAVWNLNPNQRSLVNTEDGFLVLKAGYAQDTGLEVVYIGDIAFAESRRDPPDVTTRIECSDGMKAVRETRFNVSYKEGTGAKQVLKDLIRDFPLAAKKAQLNDAVSRVPDRQFANGFAASGQAVDVLTKITSTLLLEWSIQNSELKVIQLGKADGTSAVKLSPGTGLIGSPQRRRAKKKDGGGFNGWEASSLLRPSIEPGGQVLIESADIPLGSTFRVETVYHIGDTHGDETWESRVEVSDAR